MSVEKDTTQPKATPQALALARNLRRIADDLIEGHLTIESVANQMPVHDKSASVSRLQWTPSFILNVVDVDRTPEQLFEFFEG